MKKNVVDSGAPRVTASFTQDEVYNKVQSMLPEPVALADADNLLEHGLDSLKIMRLAGEWRRAGASVTFAKLIESPCLQDWFAMLSATCEPQCICAPDHTEEQQGPFALTDVQYAYWIGRRDGQPLGGVGCHAYLEFGGRDIEPERLDAAWRSLFAHHPMLRARFLENGTQEIGEDTAVPSMVLHDMREESSENIQGYLQFVRDRLSHRRLAVEQGEVAGLEMTLLPEGEVRLHFDVDLLVADVQSLHILLRDLAASYARGTAPAAPSDWSFSKYVSRTENERREEKKLAKAYWTERLDSLPGAPGLPLAQKPESVGTPTFRRHQRRLEGPVWGAIRAKAARLGVTPAMVLLTMYAQVLARWSATSRFLINIPLFDRLSDMPGIEDVVADFTNVLLLEVDSRTGNSFLEALNDIKNRFQKDVAHCAYSGVQVQRDIARARQGERMTAPVVFACNLGTDLLTDEFKATLGDLHYMVSQTPQVWLDFQIYESDGALLLAWDAVEGLFCEGLIDDMLGAYVTFAEWLAEDGNDWITMPSLLPARQKMRREREKDVQFPETSECLHMPFFTRAESSPDKPALVDSANAAGSMTYADLAKSALKIAAYLKAEGIEGNEPVAVVLPRGTEQVAAVLGILATGAFYVPINVEQPLVRRERILQKAGVRFVLTDADRLPSDWPEGVHVLDVAVADTMPPLDAPVTASPEDTAYVIFTSGSTGEPKGVEVSHAAAWNTIEAINSLYAVDSRDVALAVSSLDFDLSVYDIFGVLAAGGSLVLLRDDVRRDAARWVDLVVEHGVTLWNSVPTLLDMLLVAAEGAGQSGLPLRQVMLSGDWIRLDMPERLAKAAPESSLVAMGGATEAAIWSNHLDVTLPLPEHWVSIPYGRPLPHQVYRVVDDSGCDCPDWVPGELWIGGAGVAKGYRGDPELTKERFLEVDGLRWYRTGDQGRFWSDGTIEFLGRQDFQVKIRGHRIEMGEIESVLLRHPAVSVAVVSVVEGATGIRRLAGHIVPAPAWDASELSAVLTEYLEQRVPEYMVPAVWNIMAELPLTANGKVDRNALSDAVSGDMEEEGRFVAPLTATEKRIASIWAEVLKVDSVGLHDSFFELGGDSLLGTQLVATMSRELGTHLPLEKLFTLPTVGELAEYLDGAANTADNFARKAAELPGIVPDAGTLHEPFPLTEIQHAYLVGRSRDLELGNVATIFYYELDNEGLDLTALNRAWGKVIARHAMLRAVVLPDGTQHILENVPKYDFPVMDISELSAEEQQATMEEMRRDMCSQVMPADHWPLFDIRVSLLGDGRVRLHIRFDCLIVDAWSLLTLIRDWHRLYTRKNDDRPPLELSFRDYVLAERAFSQTEQYRRDRDYWIGRIDTLPPAPELPLAKDPATISEPRFQRHSFTLGKESWTVFRQRAKGYGVTPSGVLAAVYAEVLKQWSRSKTLTVNLTLFNRLPMHEQVEEIVGDFTSLTLLAVDNEREETFLARAKVLQQQLFRDLDHRGYNGVELLRDIARQRGEFNRTAMPVVFTSALNMGSLGSDSGFGLLGEMGYSVSQTPQVWLDCQVYESDGNAVLTWDVVEELFPEGMINDMFAAFSRLITNLVDDEKVWTAPIPSLIPEAQLERRRQVNATEQTVSPELLHTLALRNAEITPDAPAVLAPNKTLTHGELGEYASTLGHLLRAKNVAPNTLVAIVMEKGWEQVASVLGILVSGAAYLPLDPALPAKRIQHILADAGVYVVLTQSHLKDDLVWPEHIDVVVVDTLEPEKMALPETVQRPDDLAYVIYTSGSTGLPKGVMIDHRGAVNTILDINERFAVGPEDRVLAVSNLNFDLSVYDIFGMLAAGGTIVLPEVEQVKDPVHWETLIRTHRVSVWNSVPMMMQMLVEFVEERAEGALDSLKTVLLSGDWIPLALPGSIHSLNKDTRVIGLGGATEASIWSNIFEVGDVPAHWNSIPYGKPMTNQHYHVLDEEFRDRPDWVPGNLFISGIGLAKGYWGDADKTNAAFVVHPATGERLYRTGDMGRYLSDGNIEFLGREDTQVKIGGHRIELGEIETALERHDDVQRAVAITEGEPAALAAAVVVAPDRIGHMEAEKELAAFLGEYLPQYMIPRKIMTLASLPLNVNGKVDVKAVRAEMEGYRSLQSTAGQEAPCGDLEIRLADIWMEQLELDELSRNDDFFNLGGDSLKATRILRRLQAKKIVPENVSLRTFFAASTIAGFAEQIEAAGQVTQGADELQQNNYEEGLI